ncbi:MAG: DUF2029 domain-containing protein [Candidatus Andersenbacteria bacterium]|nr:DUF2029 domain-containing protein [Candidatus Andersenbacteria bacterium]
MKLEQRMFWAFGALLVVVVALFFIPIRVPSHFPEKNPDPAASHQLTAAAPDVAVKLQASQSAMAGLVFWTGELAGLGRDDELHLFLKEDGRAVRTITTPVKKAYRSDDQSLFFAFSPLTPVAGREYGVELTLDPTSRRVLPLRFELQGESAQDIAVGVVTSRPAGLVLWDSIFSYDKDGEDIWYAWREGGKILGGSSPYMCAVDDTCYNRKNPTYMPGFYFLAAGVEKITQGDFPQWIAFWQPVFLLAQVLTGLMVFTGLVRRNQFLLAFVAMAFWLLNRWSLYTLRIGQIDFLAILFLVWSLTWWKRFPWWSLVLFGISLSIKQVAIFLGPLYLIWVWQTGGKKRVQRLGLALLAMGAVPLLVSLPFLWSEPASFLRAMLFPVTRATVGVDPIALPVMLNMVSGRMVALLCLMGVTYVGAFRRELNRFQASLLIMLIFAGLNPVLFHHYIIWLIPLIFLALPQPKLKNGKE